MCFGPSNKANRASARVLGVPAFSGLTTKEALSAALEGNLGVPRRQSNPATDAIYPPFNAAGFSGQFEQQASVLSPTAASVTDRSGNSPRQSVETDWSSPTLNDSYGNSPDYDGVKLGLVGFISRADGDGTDQITPPKAGSAGTATHLSLGRFRQSGQTGS